MDSWTLLNLSQFVATFSTGLIQRDAPRTGRVHHQWNSPLQIVGQGEWPNPPGFNVRMGARKMSEREPMGTNGNHLGTIWEPFGISTWLTLIDLFYPIFYPCGPCTVAPRSAFPGNHYPGADPDVSGRSELPFRRGRGPLPLFFLLGDRKVWVWALPTFFALIIKYSIHIG